MFSLTRATITRSAAPYCRLFLRANSTNALTKTALPFTYSAQGPTQIKYTTQHEWIAAHSDGTAFLGITKYAADALGDATYVELPEIDTTVEANESVSSVESVKSASEIYQPVAGTIIGSNEKLNDDPGLINQDPMGEAWIAKIKLNNPNDLVSEDLLSLEQYEESLKNDEH